MQKLYATWSAEQKDPLWKPPPATAKKKAKDAAKAEAKAAEKCK